jgi:hypothetical protein
MEIAKIIDPLSLPAAQVAGTATRIATDSYGRIYTAGGGATDTILVAGSQKTQIVDGSGNVVKTQASSDGYAIQSSEQYASVGEDNTNGVQAVCYKPLANSSYSLSYASTVALGTSLVVKAAPGKIMKVSGYLGVVGTDGYARFLQVHNAVSLPANTSVPMFSLPIDTRSSAGPTKFEYEFAVNFGLYANTGLVLAISSTGPTLTLDTVYSAWMQASYI